MPLDVELCILATYRYAVEDGYSKMHSLDFVCISSSCMNMAQPEICKKKRDSFYMVKEM